MKRVDTFRADWVADKIWKVAQPEYAWSFPRDHWAHRCYHMEWWYFTGHLAVMGDPSRRFGYQFTIFRIGVLPEKRDPISGSAPTDLFMGHAAVANVSERQHRFLDFIYPETPRLAEFHDPPDKRIASALVVRVTVNPWVLRWNGVGFDFQMKDDQRAVAFRLTTRPLKPLVMQGPNGYFRKSTRRAVASHYYSFTRLSTRGTLSFDDEKLKVRGTSWMDREFGSSQLAEEQVGWDWFGLQLHEGRELMLYVMRRKSGIADYRHATLVTADGRPHYLSAEEWSIKVTDTWTSSATQVIYPLAWIIDLNSEGIRFNVVPEFPEQENCSSIKLSPSYWEGAVRVLGRDGKSVGCGYVELMGYGDKGRPNM